MKIDECRSCKAKIIWTVTAISGKRMPVDAEPCPGAGQVNLDETKDPPVSSYGGPNAPKGVTWYRSHFATCPDRKDWRKQ